MPDEFDDRDDLRERSPADDDAVIEKAKSLTATPGTMLIVAAVIMFLGSFGGMYLNFGMDFNLVMLEKMQSMNPDKNFQAEMQKQIDLRKNPPAGVREMELAFAGVMTVLGMTGNVLVLMAGMFVKQLKSYTLCIIGCILAFILNGCCCIGIPIGIWTLVVLVKPEVKAGFAAMKRRTSMNS